MYSFKELMILFFTKQRLTIVFLSKKKKITLKIIFICKSVEWFLFYALLEAEEVFRDLDRDGNGFIDESELATALRRVGLNPSLKEIQSMIGEVDSDGNGTIFLCIKNFHISRKYNKFKNLSKANIIFNYLMEVGMI